MATMIWMEGIQKTYRLGESSHRCGFPVCWTGEPRRGEVEVLADEPTGALDTQTSQEVMDLLSELNRQGITIVLVTHEPNIAAPTKRIIRVQDGYVVNAHDSNPYPRNLTLDQSFAKK